MANGEVQISLTEIYEGMAQFPMATLEKVRLHTLFSHVFSHTKAGHRTSLPSVSAPLIA
jgi:hypothetical protein